MLGASFDTPEENLQFAETEGFGYRLLSDADRAVGTAYEVARDPSAEYADYPQRLSYLIDPEGVIRRAYEVSEVAEHAGHVLADLAELQG